MLRIKQFDEYRRLTSTAKTHLDREFGFIPNIMKHDIYIEFWEERKFIGVLCGDENFNEELYIEHFLINKKHRRKGYGTEIIKTLKRTYKKISAEAIETSVPFWRAMGFKKRKYQSPKYYDTIEMHG